MYARRETVRSFWSIASTRCALAVGAAILSSAALPRDALALQEVPFQLSTLGMDHPAMATLLEKTIFKVDVAWLEIWFTPEVDRQIREWAASRAESDRDSIAAVATRATDALARLHFQRNVSLSQFLDGLQSSARRAHDAGVISDAAFDDIVRSSPDWYAFLRERGIHDGDEMLYRIRGDTLRTVFRSVDGEILLDQRDVGPERRLSVLGGYLAPGSDFRRGLIESAIRGAAAAAGRASGA